VKKSEKKSRSRKVPSPLPRNGRDNGFQSVPVVSIRRATPAEAARIDRALDGLLAEYVRRALTRGSQEDEKSTK